MTEQAAVASAGPGGEGIQPEGLGKHVMEHRVSRIVAWICWPLVLLSAGLLSLGLISFITNSEFKSDSLLLFGILALVVVAS